MTPVLSVQAAKPKLEAFLFASIGEEDNGMTLSVLSGLSRLDVDPWDEAARLSQLSKAHAIEALAQCIARLPRGAWQASDATGIAARLVELLPKPGSSRDAGPPHPRSAPKRSAKLFLWMVAAGLAASLLFSLPARVERLLAGDSIVAPVVTPLVPQ